MANFDRFTERARNVLQLAQEEAARFNHSYIGTEHILLGLVREGDGVAARVLENMNVQLPKVRSAVEFIIGRGENKIVGEVGLTPRAKKVLELAVDEGRRLDHQYVGTEHLLLGLVREGEGIAAGVLESLGVNLEKLRATTMRILGGLQSVAGVGLPEAVRTRRQSGFSFWIAAAISAGRHSRDQVDLVDLLSAALTAEDGHAAAVLTSISRISGELIQPEPAATEVAGKLSAGYQLQTPAAVRAMNLAHLACVQMRLHPFASDSLLIGLLEAQEENLVAMLRAAGVSPEQLRSLVVLQRQGDPPPAA